MSKLKALSQYPESQFQKPCGCRIIIDAFDIRILECAWHKNKWVFSII